MQSSSLISVSQLYDNDCDIILNKQSLKVYKENKVILKGIRNTKDRLWDIPIKSIGQEENFKIPPIIGLYSKQPKNSFLYILIDWCILQQQNHQRK